MRIASLRCRTAASLSMAGILRFPRGDFGTIERRADDERGKEDDYDAGNYAADDRAYGFGCHKYILLIRREIKLYKNYTLNLAVFQEGGEFRLPHIPCGARNGKTGISAAERRQGRGKTLAGRVGGGEKKKRKARAFAGDRTRLKTRSFERRAGKKTKDDVLRGRGRDPTFFLFFKRKTARRKENFSMLLIPSHRYGSGQKR